jgi:predicted RNA-binding protein with PIN domain
MPYLIDGHNLIPHLPGLSLRLVDDEMRLVDWLQVFCQKKRRDVEVFFDQAPPGFLPKRRYGRITANFVRQGSTADAAIMARLFALGKSARNFSVVSSDFQVQAAARQAHATVISAEDFARELVKLAGEAPASRQADAPLSTEELAYWENLFKGKKGDMP